VITLVYGLGFGMLLVLLVVPALIAVQADIARQFGATRLALRARSLQFGLGLTSLALAAWGAATAGAFVVTGAVWAPVSDLLPSLDGAPSLQVFMWFVLGAGAITATAYVTGLVAVLAGRRKASA
jgi:hypothetical protein